MDERTKIMIEDLQKRVEFLENFLLKKPMISAEEFLEYLNFKNIGYCCHIDLVAHYNTLVAIKSGEYK